MAPLLRLLVLLALVLARPVLAENGLAGSFAYAASLDSAGRVQALQPVAAAGSPVPAEAVDAGLREQLRARNYSLDAGLAAPVSTWLQGSYRLEPEGEDYVLRITTLWAGPLVERLAPPRYPPALIRRREDADLLLSIAVAADGSARLADLKGLEAGGHRGPSRRALRDMVEAFVGALRLRPEGDDIGAPRPGTLQVQLSMRLIRDQNRRVDPEQAFDSLDWSHPWSEGVPQPGSVRVPQADYAPIQLQVTGQRVRGGR